MGHYYSEMYSGEELEEERQRKIADKAATLKALSTVIGRDGIAEVLWIMIESFEYPHSVKSKIKHKANS